MQNSGLRYAKSSLSVRISARNSPLCFFDSQPRLFMLSLVFVEPLRFFWSRAPQMSLISLFVFSVPLLFSCICECLCALRLHSLYRNIQMRVNSIRSSPSPNPETSNIFQNSPSVHISMNSAKTTSCKINQFAITVICKSSPGALGLRKQENWRTPQIVAMVNWRIIQKTANTSSKFENSR